MSSAELLPAYPASTVQEVRAQRPISPRRYSNLGRIVTFGGAGGAAAKLALDQLVFSPAFIAVFISALFTLEGNSAQIVGKLKQDLGNTVVRERTRRAAHLLPCFFTLCAFIPRICAWVQGGGRRAPNVRACNASAQVTNWKVWVPFQFINFRFVPPNLQASDADLAPAAFRARPRRARSCRTRDTSARGLPMQSQWRRTDLTFVLHAGCRRTFRWLLRTSSRCCGT